VVKEKYDRPFGERMTTQSLSTPYENIIGGRRDQALPVLGEADLLRIARLVNVGNTAAASGCSRPESGRPACS
jgi:hypothetical protein